MNEKSLIAQFINHHPNDWKELLESKNIKIKFALNDYRAIFNYGIDCDFSDPIVQEARGIIINIDTLEVVCWPFRKFGNHNESYVDDIDWDSARVQEKVDGSIVKLYWFNNEWIWATNGIMDAHNADVQGFNKTFYDLIVSAKNYKDIPFNELNHDYTYIFELVSPYNRIVVKYPEIKLYHTGTRNNITGEEYNIDIHIQKPKEYKISTFDNAIKAATALNSDPSQVNAEGFVVVDKNWHRIKIKSPEYLAAHHDWNNGSYLLSKEVAVQLALDNSWDRIDIHNHAYAAQIRFYQYQIETLEWELDNFLIHVRALYEEYSRERKPVAQAIKDHRLAYFGFKALGNQFDASDFIEHDCPLSRIVKLLPNYQLPEFFK